MELALTEGEALAVLGLRPGATSTEVDAAHRRLASRAHPDRWLGAPAEDREAARDRFEEVNAAHRALRGSQPGSTAGGVGPPRRRAPAPDPPPQPAPRPAPRPAPAAREEGESPGGPMLSRAVLIGAGVVFGLVLVASTVGLMSSSPDGSRQRRVLGPFAHRLWESERVGDFGAVYDASDAGLRALATREEFVAHLERCPPSPLPREVVRIAAIDGGRWEVESRDGAGTPGLSYFRETGDYTFAAIVTDPDLVSFLGAPVESAPDQPWCRR